MPQESYDVASTSRNHERRREKQTEEMSSVARGAVCAFRNPAIDRTEDVPVFR